LTLENARKSPYGDGCRQAKKGFHKTTMDSKKKGFRKTYPGHGPADAHEKLTPGKAGGRPAEIFFSAGGKTR